MNRRVNARALLKAVCVVLALLAIPLQLGVGAQSQAARLAYDFCGPYIGPSGGWELWCEIRLSSGESASAAPVPIAIAPGVEPAWAADGMRIAFVDYDLYIYNLTDGSRVNLTGGGPLPLDGPPRWSPDNARIAFASYADNQKDLYVVNADGSALTRLTDHIGVRGGFSWSPDGTAIAFGATVDGVPELFVMQADGSNKTRLTYNVSFGANTPSWSSDGRRIAFDCANDICSINADGTNFIRLTTDAVTASSAVFSPVDGRIAFRTSRFGGREVAILEENGAVTRVTPGLWAGQQAWAPGGDSLAFVVFGPDQICPADGSCIAGQWDMVHTVNSDGSGLREIGLGHNPRFAPTFPGQPIAAFTHACAGSACQFDATGSFDPNGSIASYRWLFGDGTTGSGATPAHQYAIGGNYNVTLIVTDNGGATGIALLNIAANHPPVASFTATCSGPACTFDASASSDPDGTIAFYDWRFGDGMSLQGPVEAIVTHAFPTGTFVVRLTVRDGVGGAASATLLPLTIVNAVPVASFTVACAGLTCTFDASASSDADSPIFYKWEFGDGGSTWGQVVAHAYSVGGAYLARLTVTDDGRQTATASRTVNVGAAPPVILEMHVGDLDGSRTTVQKTWNAFATVEIHREDHQRVDGVTVSGTWSDGTAASCTTDSTGRCLLARHFLPNKTAAVTLTVTGAVHATRVYKPAGNHDTDGGSNGTSITVRRVE